MQKRIFWIIILSFTTLISHAQNWDQVVKACASDRSSDSYYGYSVAISGEYAVVGAHGEDFDAIGQNRKINAGAAYVLHFNDTTWVEVQKLVASDRASLDYFGCSVSISGDYIFVGANMEEDDISIADNKHNLGAVYVFHNNSGVWTETQKLIASDRQDDDYFGSSLSLNGDYAIIGTYLQDYNTAGLDSIGNAGAAYIFKNNSGNWQQVQKLIAPDRGPTDYFGYSVSLCGDLAIVGAYAEDENELGSETILEAGSAYIFKNNFGVWTLEKKICAQDRGSLDFFGYSVSISSNYAIIGAYNEDEDELGSETIEGAGSAYIFENNGGTWSQVNKLVSSDRDYDDRFGYSVSISGDYAVVGAVFEDEDASGEGFLDFAGSAYIFKNNEGNWQQSRKIVAEDRQEPDHFGISVAICDTLIITGAIQQAFDSTGGGAELISAGAAYIYNLALRDISVWEDETEILCESTFYMETVTAGTSSGPIVFTVKNEGVTNLSLTGTPKLVVSGADAAYFEINESMLTSPIAPYSFSEFTVTFNPDEARDYQIQISISNTDPNENPFYFIINAPGGKIPQTITDFAPIAEKTYGDDPFTVSANASSGLAVEFSSSNPDVAICTGLNGTTVVIIGAGTCYILANQSGNDLFDVAPEVGQQLIVNPKEITVNAENKTKIYGESDPEFTYTWIPELISGDSFSGELTREPGENTGQTYEILQGTLTAGDNYSIVYNSAYLTINPKTIVVTANPSQSKLYWTPDPSEYTYSITSGSLIGTDAFSGELSRVGGEDAGFYEITIGTLNLSSNYILLYQSDYFEITSREITITANPDQSKQYGMFDPTFTYSFSEFPLAGNTFTGSLSREPGEDIGLYEITIGTLSLGINYSIIFVPDVFEITTRDLNIMVNSNQFKSYGQADPVFTYWLSGTLVNGDVITGALERQAGEAIGFYDINLGTLSAGPNYNLILFPQDFEIRTMMIVVIADPAQTKVYGDPNPLPYTYSYFGTLAPGDNFGGALSRVAGENIGEYQITQGSLSLNANYSLSYIPDYFEITKKQITVTANPGQTKMYGTENPPAYTYTVTSGNLVGTDAFNGTIKRYLGEDVGEYTIHQGNLTLSNNYQLTYISDIFTITPASITIIVDAGQNKIYGDEDPVLTYTTNVPLTYGDSFTGALSRAAGENMGTYAINQGSLNLGPNYNISFVPANFQILIKNIVVSADENQFKNYGDEDTELTYHTNSPIASWDNFTGNLTREVGEDLGFYEISLGTLALNSNYNMSFVGDDFEIIVRPITVTADAGQNKIYGDSDPAEFTYSISGTLVDGDTFIGALSRDAGENAGLYGITQGDLALTSNYDLIYIPANFEILKATPVIIWNNPADIYNNEALSATQLNATADVDGSFSYDPDFGAFLSVGDNQPLTCSFSPTDAVNYNNVEKTVYINVLLWVGMSENTGSELSVYPNPSDGIVNFDVVNQIITKIIISDINGKEIISSNLERYIDLSNFAPGVYFAKISTEQNTYIARIIRE